MARPSVAARNLSMTEELEKLEQSITLTLQEIDHNFSKAHRIVTTSILPLVEQYGENSRAVWEASKFWKQFFEASANVSLSGYEDQNNDETTGADESTAMREDTSIQQTPSRNETLATDEGADDQSYQQAQDNDESLFDDGELSGSTPRVPPATKTAQELASPYESLKREMREQEGEGEGEGDQTTVLGGDEESTVLFAQRTAKLPDITLTPRQLIEKSGGQQSAQRGKDPLLHRILDKNYRIQATPHKPALRVSPLKSKGKERAEPAKWDDTPMSSPEIAVPKLRGEAFMSPYKAGARARAAAQGPRTPGVSVQTPGTARKTRDALAGRTPAGKQGDEVEIDWDIGEEVDEDDVDLYAGMSPPKTIQFALPPSKLLQTPAGEASRRIVDDILQKAGADPESSEYSPTMVKMNEDILNDSF